MFKRGLKYLHREIDWTAIVGAALALAFCLLTLVPIATGTENAQEPAQQQTAATADAYGVPPQVPEETFWQRTTDDPVAAYTLVLAIFTIVLSVSTVGLWLKTDRLAKGAEDTARRQLRAYVGVSALRDVRPGGNSTVTLKLRNHGQTPAYKLSIIVTGKTFTPGQPRTFAHGEPDIMRSRATLGGNAEAQKELAFNPIQSDEELYLFGEATYTDVFGVVRRTCFRFIIGGSAWPAAGSMVVYEDGNESD